MNTLILKRSVGWSMLQYELTIPAKELDLYYAVSGRELPVGSRHNIKLIVNGKMFDAHFRNEAFDRNLFNHKDIVMLSYGMDVRRELQTIFKDTYDKMLAIKAKLPARARMPEVGDIEEYIVLSATSDPDVYSMDCVTKSDKAELEDSLRNIEEEQFEGQYLPLTDPGAGYTYSNSIHKVRKLDRDIGDSLKRLYNYTCQMTGERVGEEHDALVVEAHHIIPFTESMNNDTSNIIILSPSYHRIVHKAKPEWLPDKLAFQFPNGLVERVKVNLHL